MFNKAQTFNVDKDVVRGADNIIITSVDLYFKEKPLATGNKSGITEPGVTVKIAATKDNGVPDLTRILQNGTARKEYNEILASSTAELKTNFKFDRPVIVQTNKIYAILVSFDGDEDYVLWAVKEGEYLVGTNTRTSGATAKNVVNLYDYTSVAVVNPTVNQYVGNNTVAPSYSSDVWKPINNTDLKFAVYCGAFASVNSISTSNIASPGNTALISNTVLQRNSYDEYILFNRYSSGSANTDSATYGEFVFQETPVVIGTISVNRDLLTVNAISANINFSTLYNPSANNPSYMIIRNPSTGRVDVRKIEDIYSNTQVLLDRRPSFTSNSATFSISPVAKLSALRPYNYFGQWWNPANTAYRVFTGEETDLMILTESNANSTVRFVNNMVTAIAIANGGSGYANSDYVVMYVTGITGQVNGAANVVTNSTGGITSITISNSGLGFTNTATFLVKNANNVNSAGIDANLTITIGANIRTELTNAYFANCLPINIEAHRVLPHLQIHQNYNHRYEVWYHTPYYLNSSSGQILLENTAKRRELKPFVDELIIDTIDNDGRVTIIPSRSIEVGTNTATINTTAGNSTSIEAGAVLEYTFTSNNIFSVPCVVTPDLYVYSFIINDDYTNEHKSYGNALAKHISTKINFGEDRYAEDIMVYVRAHRPANTNIKVYARIHNSNDGEAFDDKDYTLLECVSNNENVFSSLTNANDYIEYAYSFPSYPNTHITLGGTVTLETGNATVIGLGTTLSSNLAVNDLIKIYDPLFTNNYFITVVNSVTNATHMTISDTTANNSLLGAAKKVDLLGRAANSSTAEVGYPHQAFNYSPNDNVVRYYTSSMTPQDTYNSFSIKVVMLANNRSVVPKIEDVRAVGVSA